VLFTMENGIDGDLAAGLGGLGQRFVVRENAR
jgi:hypothetical protein